MGEKKSNFSVACSLLSQLMKERRINGELGSFDMGSRPQEPTKGLFRASTTMSLLPGANISAENETDTTETISATEQSTAKPMDLFPQQTGFGSASADTKTETKQFEMGQLTIFYCGKVLVFDNFPAEKAEDLMQLAAKGSSPAASAAATTASALPVCCPTSGSKPEQATPSPSDLPMPIARRASLHRFFAKRKDRIISKAPYQINGNSSSMGESSKLA